MKTFLLCIYDRKTKQYEKPFTSRSTERIQDEFDVICADSKVSYSKHPEDYEIHELGIFNDSPHHEPEIKNFYYDQPKVIASGRKVPDLAVM